MVDGFFFMFWQSFLSHGSLRAKGLPGCAYLSIAEYNATDHHSQCDNKLSGELIAEYDPTEEYTEQGRQ